MDRRYTGEICPICKSLECAGCDQPDFSDDYLDDCGPYHLDETDFQGNKLED